MSAQVDLQATSIDLTPSTVKVGNVAEVTTIMANNGPEPIPLGEATAHITLSSVFFTKPYKFKDIEGGQWKLLGIDESTPDQYNLYFQNNGAEVPVTGGPNYGFTFKVKGKKATQPDIPADVTLTSSLSLTATSSDVNGENQFASAKVPVVAKRKYTKKVQ